MAHFPASLSTAPSTLTALSFPQKFFTPVLAACAGALRRRLCPELSDETWLPFGHELRAEWQLGVRRALEDRPSGRAFLQHLVANGCAAPETGHFFETLKSARRLGLVAEVSHAVAARLPVLDPSLWESLPELAAFDLYAGDGHFHGAAAHDRRDPGDGVKYAVGHFFTLNLRTHALTHLTMADQVARKKEHDMRALKRTSLEALRQGAVAGRKVLEVWDRAVTSKRKADYENYLSLYPNGRYVELEASGHVSYAEQPEAFAHAVPVCVELGPVRGEAAVVGVVGPPITICVIDVRECSPVFGVAGPHRAAAPAPAPAALLRR